MADRLSGAILKNPCRDATWEELIKAGVAMRHEISNLTAVETESKEVKKRREKLEKPPVTKKATAQTLWNFFGD